VRYRPVASEDPDLEDLTQEEAIIRAVDEAAREGPGDVLVFLPGEREIRETAESLRKHHVPDSGRGREHIEIVPLYSFSSREAVQGVAEVEFAAVLPCGAHTSARIVRRPAACA